MAAHKTGLLDLPHWSSFSQRPKVLHWDKSKCCPSWSVHWSPSAHAQSGAQVGTPWTKTSAPREVRRAIMRDPRQGIPKTSSLPHPDASQMMGWAVTDARGKGFANIPCSRYSIGKSIPNLPQAPRKKLSVWSRPCCTSEEKVEGVAATRADGNILWCLRRTLNQPTRHAWLLPRPHGSTTSVISKLGFVVIFFS